MLFAGTPGGKFDPMARVPPPSFRLVPPCREWLGEYEQALAAGWSPNTEQDISQSELRELRRDPDAYLDNILHGTTIRRPDGTVVPRLPARDFWIVDDSFCGRIGLRFQPGTEELPAHVSGHVGYSVVAWKRGRGYATEALRRLLPYARAEGLSRVLITCDDDNHASQRVILANGGIAAGRASHPSRPGHFKLSFWVRTPEP